MTDKNLLSEEKALQSSNNLKRTMKYHLASIEFLHDKFFFDILTDEELMPCWMMTGECLKLIIEEFKSTIKDIENDVYFPSKEVQT